MSDGSLWIPDEWFSHCLTCDIEFTRTKRRHHCRCCGLVVCEACSQTKEIVPTPPVLIGAFVAPLNASSAADAKKPQRICTACKDVIMKVRHAVPPKEPLQSDRCVFAHRIAMVRDLAWKIRLELYTLAAERCSTHDLTDYVEGSVPGAVGNGSPARDPASPVVRHSSALPIGTVSDVTFSNDSRAIALQQRELPADAAGRKHRRFSNMGDETLQGPLVDAHGATLVPAFTSTAQDRLVELQAKLQEWLATREQAVLLNAVLKRHSLRGFFHQLFSALHSIVISNVMSLRNDHYVPFGKTSPVTVRQVSCTAHLPVFTLNLLQVVGLRENSQPVELCNKLGLLLFRVTLRVACRYQEQIACLSEASALDLADTVLFRVLTHAANQRSELSSLAAVQDYVAEALLVQKPLELPILPLVTRVPSEDSGWTDHGVLTQSGIRTAEGGFFDTIGASTFYYRFGTEAEAVAMKMQKVATRSVNDPLVNATELLEQRDRLIRMRNTVLAQYASAHFAPPDQRSWAVKDSGSTDTQLHICVEAIRSIRDFLTNRQRLINQLVMQVHATNEELARISKRVSNISQRLKDFVPRYRSVGGLGVEDRLISEAIEAGEYEVSRSVGAMEVAQPNKPTDYRLVLWNQFCDIVLSSQGFSVMVFYTHLRLKLTGIFLCSMAYSRIDEPEHLMGNPVPPKRTIRSVADSWIATASQDATMRTWCIADIIDYNCDVLARAVTERHRSQVDFLNDASVAAFAECCAARLIYLIDNNPDLMKASQWSKTTSLVRHMGDVDLGRTVVTCSRVYLQRHDSATTLREHHFFTKAGLRRNEDFQRFVREQSTAKKLDKPHNKPLKYGYLQVPASEIDRTPGLWIAGDEGEPVQRYQTASSPTDRRIAPPETTIQGLDNSQGTFVHRLQARENELSYHWPSSLVSCGPSALSVNDTIGVTVRMRSKNGNHVAATSNEQVHFRVITHRRSTVTEKPATATLSASPMVSFRSYQQSGSVEDLAVKEDSPSPPAPRRSTSAVLPSVSDHTTTFKVTTAGVCVVGAILNGWMVISNILRVRPGPASWDPQKSGITVHPACCVAGGSMDVCLTLRDNFGNIVASMDADHFNINVMNDDVGIAASRLEQHTDGAFYCTIKPVTSGTIKVSAIVGNYAIEFNSEPLTCIAGPAEFKNSVLSFDELEVVPGTEVHGNLLLRDAFGNRIEGDEREFDVELINGDRTVLQRSCIHNGEYVFSFTPTRRGTATVRAVCRRTGEFAAATINVIDSEVIDWNKCVIACIASEVFAGEPCTFHLSSRDAYGNANASLDATKLKHRVYHPSTDEEAEVSELLGAAPSITFTAVIKRAIPAVAVIEYDGVVVATSQEIKVSPGALCWDSSKLIAPRVAEVGEWIPVQILCRDIYGNPTPANAGDFTVAAVNEGFVGSSKTVEGGGSSFGFRFLALKTGTAQALVTYAGHQEYVATVIMRPAKASWPHSTFKSTATVVRAGEDTVVVAVSFFDQYGNAAFKVNPGELTVRVVNEKSTYIVTDIIDEVPPRSDESLRNDPLPTPAESRMLYHFKPTVAGHVQAFVKMQGEALEKSGPIASVVSTVASWEHCTWEFGADRSVAGVALSAKLTIVDRFLNPTLKLVDWPLLLAPTPESLVAVDVSSSPKPRLAAEESTSSIEALPDYSKYPAVTFDEVIHFNAVHHGMPEETAQLKIVPTDSSDKHIIIMQINPLVAGPVDFTVSLRCPERLAQLAPQLTTILSGEKRLETVFTHFNVEWVYGSGVEHAETVVAGTPFIATVSIRDAFNNSIPLSHAVTLLEGIDKVNAMTIREYPEDPLNEIQLGRLFTATLTESQGRQLHALLFAMTIPPEFVEFHATLPELQAHQFRVGFIPQTSGSASLVVSCRSKPHVPTSVNVLPAHHVWPTTTTVWEHDVVSAGLPCECVIQFRDAFSNLTPDRAHLDTLSAVVLPEDAELVKAPSFEIRGDKTICSFVSNLIGAFKLQIKCSASDVLITTKSVRVEASDVYWSTTELVAVQPFAAASGELRDGTDAPSHSSDTSPKATSKASVPDLQALRSNTSAEFLVAPAFGLAGEPIKFMLRLKDRFGNPAWRGVTKKDLVPRLLSPGGLEAARETVTIEGVKIQGEASGSTDTVVSSVDTKCTCYVASILLTRAGDYGITMSCAPFQNEAAKGVAFRIRPAAVDWPAGCEWSLDVAQVEAGTDLFFLLETRDCFKNLSSNGIVPVANMIRALVHVEPNGAEPSSVEGILLHQPVDGTFGLHYMTSLAGKVYVSATMLSQDAQQLRSAKAEVVATEPAWQGSSLVPTVNHPIAGVPTAVKVILCDRFTNPLQPEAAREQLMLVMARVEHAGVDGAEAAPLACTVEDEWEGQIGLWIVFTPTRTGLIDIAASHADSTATLKAQVTVLPGPLHKAAVAATSPSTLVAGTELTVQYALRDEFGNVMTETVAQDLVAHFAYDASPSKPITMQVVECRPAGTFTAKCTPTLAGNAKIHLRMAEKPDCELGANAIVVEPDSALAERCPIHIDSKSGKTDAVAGEAFSFVVTLHDAYGNIVPEFPNTATVVVTNGTAQVRPTVTPSVGANGQPEPGTFCLSVAPTQAGSVRVDIVFAANRGTSQSPTITVAPGELHWPSCGVKVVEERVSVGHETAVIIVAKDRFGNPVQAAAGSFVAYVEHLDDEGQLLQDAPQQTMIGFSGSKTLTAQARVTKPGKCRVAVIYDADPAAKRYSPVIIGQ